MRITTEKDYKGHLVRLFAKHREVAYIKFGLSGLQAEIEFPSDWREDKFGWIRLGLGLFRIAFAFPWSRVVDDDGQCSGPTYGFLFFDDGLHIHWGKMKGKRTDPFTILPMPWRWNHVEHKVLSDPEAHPYTYKLKNGEVQNVIATISAESREWKRRWLPFRKLSRSIDVNFNGEVGEGTGSWKGGTIGCGYEMLDGESPLDTLRRMERERIFS